MVTILTPSNDLQPHEQLEAKLKACCHKHRFKVNYFEVIDKAVSAVLVISCRSNFVPVLLPVAVHAAAAARLQHRTRGVVQARGRGRSVGGPARAFPCNVLSGECERAAV